MYILFCGIHFQSSSQIFSICFSYVYSRNGSADGPASLSLARSETPTSPERETAPVNREGALSCKFMELEGKVSAYFTHVEY